LSEILKPPASRSFEELLVSLAGQAILTQRQLDAAYAQRLKDFEAFVPVTALSRAFPPSRLVMQTQQAEVGFSTTSQSLTEIRIINQVISKRYRSQSVKHTVRIEVLRSAFRPGEPTDPK